jgi:hypothetical protein
MTEKVIKKEKQQGYIKSVNLKCVFESNKMLVWVGDVAQW